MGRSSTAPPSFSWLGRFRGVRRLIMKILIMIIVERLILMKIIRMLSKDFHVCWWWWCHWWSLFKFSLCTTQKHRIVARRKQSFYEKNPPTKTILLKNTPPKTLLQIRFFITILLQNQCFIIPKKIPSSPADDAFQRPRRNFDWRKKSQSPSWWCLPPSSMARMIRSPPLKTFCWLWPSLGRFGWGCLYGWARRGRNFTRSLIQEFELGRIVVPEFHENLRSMEVTTPIVYNYYTENTEWISDTSTVNTNLISSFLYQIEIERITIEFVSQPSWTSYWTSTSHTDLESKAIRHLWEGYELGVLEESIGGEAG